MDPMDAKDVIDESVIVRQGAEFFIIQDVIKVFDPGFEDSPHAQQTGLQRNQKNSPLEIAAMCLCHRLAQDTDFSMLKRIVLLLDGVSIKKNAPVLQDKHGGDRDFPLLRQGLRFLEKSVETILELHFCHGPKKPSHPAPNLMAAAFRP